MSKDLSEYIDDYCEDNYGHTNWAYLDTLTKEELEANKDKGDIDKLNNLFFYYEDDSNNLQIEAMLESNEYIDEYGMLLNEYGHVVTDLNGEAIYVDDDKMEYYTVKEYEV